MTGGVDYQQVVFLDTNALHYMSSYLRSARKYELPPYAAEAMEYGDVQKALKERLPAGIADVLMSGCKTLAYLEGAVAEDEEGNGAVVYTSRLSIAEILYGVLDGQAHARMAREGIPYRMRQRLSDMSRLVSMYLDRTDYENVRQEVYDILTTLRESAGISIGFVEEGISDDFSRILVISEYLQSTVFLDVLDCWMYGCAVVVQANQIITFDGYFREVANHIHSPGNEDWQKVRRELKAELARLFPVDTGVPLSLPEVRDLPKQVPRSWEVNSA